MKPELLAPAGSVYSLIAAVNAGADAVYFGAGSHNARNSASLMNSDTTSAVSQSRILTDENIATVTEYCHVRGVKAYLALNTLIKDKEICEVEEIVKQAYSAKIDAIIIQDIGLLKIIKNKYPELIIHASTQMGINNAAAAYAAKKLGIDRVILSRETRLADIKEINNLGIETEVFIHGANCVCFSGNCYFSSLVSGYSGNRGRCMQLCRKAYAPVINGKKSDKAYLLSMKDNCLIGELKTLAEAGVNSFKIEGRLRRPEYAGGTTAVYRKVIDNNYQVEENDINILKTLFNRGNYINAQLYSSDDIAEQFFPGHIGINAGKVTSVSGKTFSYSGKKLNQGDGIKFVRGNVETGNAEITEDNLTFKGDVKTGDIIMFTTDTELNTRINNIPDKKIAVSVDAIIKDDILTVKIMCGDNKAESSLKGESARNNPTTDTAIKESFGKIDLYPYNLNITVSVFSKTFFAKSQLNALRRSLYEQFYRQVLDNYNPAKVKHNFDSDYFISKPVICNDIININNYSQLSISAVPEDCIISYSPDCYSQVDNRPAYLAEKKVFLNLPVIAYTDDVALLDKSVREYDGLIVNNLYGLTIANKYNMPYIAGTGLNIFNSLSGYTNYIQSVELNKHESLKVNNAYIYAFGKFPFMNMTLCPHKANGANCNNCKKNNVKYADEFGIMDFRSIEVKNCSHLLLNSLPIDILSDVKNKRYIDLTLYSKEDCAIILTCAARGINTPFEHTKGLYKRGVK